ncbi:MAG: histidinol-phosphate transaminase [Candidatus Omnitrophica bacterium]|nr:histidinol-phosphate transaminase [Candidatus Omnitrophota bacterium]MDD5352327.1 histidinol-phosphate transaminase [Candidatus Omnitrophota bacterium]MDD5549925.1 histidinol-phosphate transaminase [Candidatus Omnitrophota bacterium]
MKEILRKDIDRINAYVPGKPIDLVQREMGIKKVIKLASNENPFGVSPKAKKAIQKSLNEVFRYPDGSCYYLKNTLAKKLRLSPDNILFGNGSDEIIDIIIKTFLNAGEEVLTSQTTFVEYEIIAKANGFRENCIPLKNFRYDLDAIKNNINEKTKVIFIANPNNPTGTYVNENELSKFIKEVPKDKLIVVDEAYWDFTDVDDFPGTIDKINSENLIVLRTFSKAYGLAGLRIGYAVANSTFIKAMEKIRQPFNVNTLAQRAAQAVLNDDKFLEKTRKLIIAERKKIYQEFKKMNIEYVPSQANFIMFKTEMDGLALCKQLLKKGIIIRDLKQYGLENFVRVTIGKPWENKLFIRTLKKILKEEK